MATDVCHGLGDLRYNTVAPYVLAHESSSIKEGPTLLRRDVVGACECPKEEYCQGTQSERSEETRVLSMSQRPFDCMERVVSTSMASTTRPSATEGHDGTERKGRTSVRVWKVSRTRKCCFKPRLKQIRPNVCFEVIRRTDRTMAPGDDRIKCKRKRKRN